VKIHSTAQLAMFTKAAADPDYASSRGISQEMAQQHLDAHKQAGEPDLPERAARKLSAAATQKPAAISRPTYLQSQRNQ
jgi:hypothetical protein